MFVILICFAAACFVNKMASGVEHFDGGSLPSEWVALTANSGTVTLSDSNVVAACPSANGAAAIYKNGKLDKTVHQMHTFCFRINTAPGVDGRVYLLNRATAPIVDAAGTFDAQGITRAQITGTGGVSISQWDTGGTRRVWDNSTQTWSATTTLQAVDTFEIEDYLILTVEIDPNQGQPRFRWAGRGRTQTTFAADQAERQSILTDWILFSNARTNTDIWISWGWPFNDNTSTGTQYLEWYRYSEGVEKDYCFTNAKDGSTDYLIRASYGLDYEWYLPVDRTTITVDKGAASAWDDVHVKDPYVVKDASTYYLFYAGKNSSTSAYQIGLATSANPEAAFTKDAGNPVVPRAAGTSRDWLYRPTVWKDLAETDQSKKWKMLCTGLSSADSKNRIFYATSPAPSGPWTVNTTAVIDVGGAGDFDERSCNLGFVMWDPTAAHYKVWYAGNSGASGVKWSIGLATSNGDDITSLTKDTSNNPYIPRAADAKQVITSQSTRTSNMTDTTGFEKDQPVAIDQDATNTQFILSRVRKVTTNTSIELYNKPAGITGNTAEVVGWNYGATDIRSVRYLNGVWYFHITCFAFHLSSNGDNFDCGAETCGILTSTNLLDKPKTWKWLATPFVPLSQSVGQMTRGFSNENPCFVTTPLRSDPVVNPAARKGIGRHK